MGARKVILSCLVLLASVTLAQRVEEEALVISYSREGDARLRSRNAMLARQSSATRADPRTGTLYLFPVIPNRTGDAWGIVVDAADAGALTLDELGRAVLRGVPGESDWWLTNAPAERRP